MDIVDIGSTECELGACLSNFTEYHFVFDGISCNSMEGLLQSFKFVLPERQAQICQLIGVKAKRKGQKKKWYKDKQLYWQGETYNRLGDKYQSLVDRAFDALAQNKDFQIALKRTGSSKLAHSMGKQDACFTILTESEFCERLERIRIGLAFGKSSLRLQRESDRPCYKAKP